MSLSLTVHTLTLPWALPGKRGYPQREWPLLGVPQRLTVVGSVRDAPADTLNNQGGAASQSFGVLLITFYV